MRDEFSANTSHLLNLATERCTRRGARLTELRRDVLGLVLDSASPSGAYDLMERLRRLRGGQVAPPTVYRALDFLVEHGFIHRVERLAAFVGCIGDSDHAHQHAAQFLICEKCKKVAEIEDHAIAHALADAAARIGFLLARSTIEAEGLCAVCATQSARLPPAG